MEILAPLAVAIPLLGAAVLVTFGKLLHRWMDDAIALAATAATLAVCVVLVLRATHHDVVYWFGGWQPRQGLALGVSFTIDESSAAIAALAAGLACAALVFSWRYFDEVGKLFSVLILVFVGGMVGFSLSGDLFNMFVWFELMSVAAYALTGYGIRDPAPLQGAINFAVTNSVGSFAILFGLGLVYARTGALNLDQIGAALAGHSPDGLVVVAFTLLAAGFLTKAGAAPFHLWLADAYSVAPIPVCVLLTGVMSDLGIHAIARIYWPAFSGTLAAHDLRPVLVGFGIATALIGGWMCFLQRDLKRLLAFATISNIGIVLVGTGLLTDLGLASTSVYVNTNGLLRGALFLAVGVLVRRFGSGDELRLRSRGKAAPITAGLAGLAALALALLPPFGPFFANSLVLDSANEVGYGWVGPVVVLATILTVGTIMRAGLRIFAGVGDRSDPLLSAEPNAAGEEPDAPARVSPPLLWAPIAALVVCGVGLAFIPDVAGHALHDASRLMNRSERAREVLHGIEPAPKPLPSYSPSGAAYAWAVVSVLGSLLVAGLGLYRQRLPVVLRRALGLPARTMQALHSGAIGDYVTWFVVGTTVLGGLFAVVVR
jgi:multicomponent Na+:H+ antiporter subunit D